MDQDRARRLAALHQESARRILVLDGAMGTMIQSHQPTEADYRGGRFQDWHKDLKGNNDLLCLTRPDMIAAIHDAYFAAGADIGETNSFSATTIAQADYGLESVAYELNLASARLARAAADRAERADGRVRWVAGAIGPTNRTGSISPDVNDPGFRNVTYDELATAYGEAARGLIEGGADLLLVETVFDTLNAKAALWAIAETFEAIGFELPVIVSGTITDRSGRTLSGQTAEAFWLSVAHARPFAVSLNCALGPDLLRPYVADLARCAWTRVGTYPNAGLPNAFGGYDLGADEMAGHLREWAESGLVNFIGGCCGTTPDHIRAMVAAVRGVAPRPVPERAPVLRLAGLEPFALPLGAA